MVDAYSPNFSLDGLGLELGSVGRCVSQPPPRQMTGLLSRRVSYFPLRPNDKNDDDETDRVRGAPRPPPPPPATPHRA